ncbi:fibronectin type III domain-containing protein [Paenibacillus rigui]|uniref:Fibronectin type-III domain-containing protein n=1 Tax=Paenibacillus rigui TaxID=554312 RepID=A0A229UMM5_9BACL|nr:cohesin domain-containing protein [Paenibacillus rigui]OXM84621.1 hypothetical protein CF651_19130 [Paenibacillus rigui]
MKKYLSIFLFVFVLVMMVPVSSAFAATVGQSLTVPETGWQRFDDTASQFLFSNFTNPRATQSGGNYNGTVSYSNDLNARVDFKFTGKKIRIITQMASSRDPLAKITIDGINYTYSEKSSSLIFQALVFEKQDLSDGTHTVTLTRNSPSTIYFTLDAVDIDASGQLLSSEVPDQLQALSGDATVTLNWNSVPAANGYVINYGTSTGVYNKSVTVSSNTYSVKGLTNGTTYYFVVAAITTNGVSGNSNEVSAKPLAPVPSTPLDLNATSSNNQAILSWTPSSGATSYNVKKATQSGGPYTIISNNVTGATYFVDANVTPGTTYYYVVSAVNESGESANSNEVSLTPVALDPSLNVIIAEDKVKVGQEFIASIDLKNVKNIYAEDFTIKYDNTLFEFVGFEEIPGYKIYNQPAAQNGSIRFIVASQGKDNGISDEKVFLKLKLRAKAAGTGKVDATKCRIADTEKEFDLLEANCTEDTVTVEGPKDVNRTGEYTLLDLAIDGYYYGELASNADPSKYDANQAGDEYVKDEDLVYIVNQMLLNTNYPLNG